MSDNKPDQEPSIEEILASIRQIISDDEETPVEAAPKPASPPPPPKAASPPPPPKPAKPDVLELTDVVEEADDEEPLPEPEPLPRRMEIDMREADETDDAGSESILTPNAASATLEGFVKLSSQMALDHEGTGALTIEDVVKALLKPMLREWLDSNLPQLIEKLVQKELDQIARRAMDD